MYSISLSPSLFLILILRQGPPRIIRFFGKGVSVEPSEEGFKAVLSEFAPDIVSAYRAMGDNEVEVYL